MKTPTNLFELVQGYMAAVEAAQAKNLYVVTYDADTSKDLTEPPKRPIPVARIPWSDNAARRLLSESQPATNQSTGGYTLPMPRPEGW